MQKTQGIVFDMDNTVIHSFIDFPLMQAEVRRILLESGIPYDDNVSVTPNMQAAHKNHLMTSALWDHIWQRIGEIEFEGLSKAVLEPGILDILEGVKPHAKLFLITNNVHADAEQTMVRLGVRDYFDILVGRGVTPALKPSPAGILYVLEHFPDLRASDCMAIGDAVIDIQSAQAAGINRFIAYNSSHMENWQRIDQKPRHYLKKWDEQALDILLEELKKEV